MNNFKIELYDACLNKTYHNPNIEPLINGLYSFIEYYDKSITTSQSKATRDGVVIIERTKSDIVNKILPVLERIVQNGYYDDFDNTMDLLINNKIHWFEIISYLKLFYLKEEMYESNKIKYFMEMRNLLSHFCFKPLNIIDNKTYLFQLIKCYKKYYASSFVSKKGGSTAFMTKYGSIILGIIYYKYELNDLELVLDKITKNFEEVYNYFLLNGIEDNITEIDFDIKYDLINNIIINNKIKRKIIN